MKYLFATFGFVIFMLLTSCTAKVSYEAEYWFEPTDSIKAMEANNP